jgi:hypothetical protein
MALAALVTWAVTAVGGLYLAGTWLANGGLRAGRSRIRPMLVLSHLVLASTGLALWVAYLATDEDVVGWAAFGLLLVVVGLGLTMLATSSPAYHPDRRPDGPAEGHFPTPVVGGHGMLALTTLVLVLLANLGIGGS